MDEKTSSTKKLKFPEDLINELGREGICSKITPRREEHSKLLGIGKKWPVIFNNGLSIQIPENSDEIIVKKNGRKVTSIPYGGIAVPAVVKVFPAPQGSDVRAFVSMIYYHAKENTFYYCNEKIPKKKRFSKSKI